MKGPRRTNLCNSKPPPVKKGLRGAAAIADAVRVTLGAEGAVTVEEAKGTETTMEVVEGMQLLLTEATMTEVPEPKHEPAGTAAELY